MQIGNMDADRENFENPQCGRVYDSSGLSPTINTCQGGQREPKIIVENIPCKLDKMPDGCLGSLDNAKVCDVGTKTASTVTARYCKGISAHKDNMFIVAMRGRNPDNPSDRTAGSPTEQRLEPNGQGMCNTLTSVQKDNMVLESAVLTPKRSEYGKSIRKAYERGEVKESWHNMAELEPRGDGISNTLTTVQKDNLVIEPAYRIRKLTPLECWRLMGFSDEDFRKAEEVNSNSQLYRQAGNSIVKNVLIAVLGQMVPGKKNWYKEL